MRRINWPRPGSCNRGEEKGDFKASFQTGDEIFYVVLVIIKTEQLQQQQRDLFHFLQE